jgi:hypothetical protein
LRPVGKKAATGMAGLWTGSEILLIHLKFAGKTYKQHQCANVSFFIKAEQLRLIIF